MRALARVMITKKNGAKHIIKVHANVPGDSLDDRVFAAVEKALKKKFSNSTVYLIDLIPENE